MDKKNKEIEELKIEYEDNKSNFLKEIDELKENNIKMTEELKDKNENNNY